MEKIMARVTKGKLWTSILGVLILAAALVVGYNHHVQIGKSNQAAKDKASLEQAKKLYGQLPLAFEPNRGQTDSRVQFLARSAGYNVFLTSAASATMEFKGDGDKLHVVTMNLAGAKGTAKPQPEVKQGRVSHYYIGNDSSKWVTGVPNYSQVRYNGLYPGVAVVYQGDNQRFRYDFEVAPGADPSAIHWTYDGADNLSVDEHGALVVSVGDSQLTSSKPYIYQEYGGVKHPVEGGYSLNGKDVAFEIARYDSTKPLVIDPFVSTGTFLGGTATGNTILSAIANNGTNIFVTGYTLSASYPVTKGETGSLAAPQGNEDAVVTELDYTMNSTINPIFSAYLGGSGNDRGLGVALDGSGNVIVVGYTESGAAGFPSLNAIPNKDPNNFAQHAFVTSLTAGTGSTAGGGVLNFSTQLYGAGATSALGVAWGNKLIHITGSTESNDLVTAIGYNCASTIAPSIQCTNNSTIEEPNAFYVALSESGTGAATKPAVAYATYFGGCNSDEGSAVTWNAQAGVAVIAGSSSSFTCTVAGGNPVNETILPVMTTAATTTHPLVFAINPGNGTLSFSEVLGNGNTVTNIGSGFEAATAVSSDALGNIYVGGYLNEDAADSNETIFTNPGITLAGTTTPGAGATDGFEVELLPIGGVPATGVGCNNTAAHFSCGTLVTGDEVNGNQSGPSGSQTEVTGIAVDALGNAYVSGFTTKSSIGSLGALVRRRINTSGYLIDNAGVFTSFLFDFPQQGTGANLAVTAVGDLMLNNSITSVQVPGVQGAANGMAYDPLSGNACVAGFVSDVGATGATNLNNGGAAGDTVVLPSAYQIVGPLAKAPLVANPPFPSTGVVVCNLFQSDTYLTSNSSNFNSVTDTFSFSINDGGNKATPASGTIVVSNNDLSVNVSNFALTTPVYTPPVGAFTWLSVTQVSGNAVLVTINATGANGAGMLDPGFYQATFVITPGAGDNANIPQTITVDLQVTGLLDEDTTIGGGSLLTTNVNAAGEAPPLTCSDTAPIGCTVTLSQNSAGTFSDGNKFETIQVPLVSIVQLFEPSQGNIEFNEAVSGTVPFATVADTTAGPNGPGCNGAATPNACYITVTLSAAAFKGLPTGTYTDTVQVEVGAGGGGNPQVTPAFSPVPGAPLNPSTSFIEVANPAPLIFKVIVTQGQLTFHGKTDFSSPVGAAGDVLLVQSKTSLDSASIGTSQAETFTSTVSPASLTNPISCNGGVTATLPFPAGVLQLNLTGQLQASNNTTVTNPGFTATETPEPISIANPGLLNPGVYGESVVFIPVPTGLPSAPVNICLTVGNQLFITLQSQEALPITSENPGGTPVPFVIEAGSNFSVGSSDNFQSLADVLVTAVGSPLPVIAAPPPIAGIPVSVTASGPAVAAGWATLAVGSGVTSLNDAINLAPPLVTSPIDTPVTFTVSTTDPNSLLPPTGNSVTLDVIVTSGLGLFFGSSQAGNNIIASPPIPGGSPSEIPPGPPLGTPPATPCSPAGTITLCFTSILGSGIVNPAGDGKIFVVGSQDEGEIDTAIPDVAKDLKYVYAPGSVPFLNPASPSLLGTCTSDIDPINLCTLEVKNFNNAAVASLPLGTYEASFTADFINGNIPNLPVPSTETVDIILQVVNFPTVTVTPGAITFNVTQGGIVPPRTITLTASAIPAAGPIPFTATPSGMGVLLNGGTAAIKGFIVDTAGDLIDGNNNPITLVASVTSAGLTTVGSPYNGGIAFSFGSVAIPVSDPSVNLPITINVSTQPGLSICNNIGGASANTCGTYNWTVGDPVAAPNTPTNMQIILIGTDTYTVTSSAPWAVVGPLTNPNNAALNTVAVSLNLAMAPTAPGTYTATITLAGLQGSESPAVTSIVLIVAGPPSLTLAGPAVTSGTGTAGTVANPGTPGTTGNVVNYNYGSPNPNPISIAESITNTVDNPTLTLTYSAITYSAGATGWLTLTTAPATINNSGATLIATVNPTSPAIPPASGYTATFTVTSNDPTGAIPANYSASVTYTVSLNVFGSLSATAANTLFTYVVGTSSANLPLVITSQPSGVAFSVTTGNNMLASSVLVGTTPNTPQISVNGLNVKVPGQASGSITVSVLNSGLNCPAAQVSGVYCSVTVPFNINVHSNFFQGEKPASGGFYTLTFPDLTVFPEYAYFPNQLAIYSVELGEQLLFTTIDASGGIYMYDVDSQNIWYTNPSLYPDFYDFTTSQWLQYIPGSGNGSTGSRKFYSWTLNTTTGMYVYSGMVSK